MNRETYLTADQVAEWLGVSAEQVYRLGRRKLIPCVKLAGTVRFPETALAKFLEERAHPGEDSGTNRAPKSIVSMQDRRKSS